MISNTVLNSTQWQQIRQSDDNAQYIVSYLLNAYEQMNYSDNGPGLLRAYNSLINLHQNKKLTVSQLCEWVELNATLYRGRKNRLTRKDTEYIVGTVARLA